MNSFQHPRNLHVNISKFRGNVEIPGGAGFAKPWESWDMEMKCARARHFNLPGNPNWKSNTGRIVAADSPAAGSSVVNTWSKQLHN